MKTPEQDALILEMQFRVALIEHENLVARREESLGGWLCDHSAVIRCHEDVFAESRKRLLATLPAATPSAHAGRR